jgi:hypothetical protein
VLDGEEPGEEEATVDGAVPADVRSVPGDAGVVVAVVVVVAVGAGTVVVLDPEPDPGPLVARTALGGNEGWPVLPSMSVDPKVQASTLPGGG